MDDTSGETGSEHWTAGVPSLPSLPAPPPVPPRWAAMFATRHRRHRRPGDLAPGWAAMFATSWLLVALGLGAVWVSSRTTGLSTWWLGPEARPAFVLWTIAPFVLPVAVVTGTLVGIRGMPALGVAAAAATAAVGIGDVGRVAGYGVVELVLAGAGLLVSLGASGGMFRRSASMPGEPAAVAAEATAAGTTADR